MFPSINQSISKMSWTFARARSSFLVQIKLFFPICLSSFFLSCSCSLAQYITKYWRLTRSYIHISVSQNGIKNWTHPRVDIRTLVNLDVCSSGFYRSFFFIRRRKKNRNDLPFCFFNRFIVRVPSWYFFLFSFCLYRNIISENSRFFFFSLYGQERERERT